MKLAFTSKGTSWDSHIDSRFGRTDYILLYDEEKDDLVYFDNRDIEKEAHGAGVQTSKKLFEMSPDVLITGNGPGGNASSILEKTKIKIFVDAGDKTIKEAYEAYKKGELKVF